jgi:hypothetical protein
MPHQSPFDEDVYREWERQSVFASPEPTPEEARAIWAALFERVYVGGRWTCDPVSATLVTSAGVSHAMRQGKPDEAERLAGLFLQFDREKCDWVDWTWHWNTLGTAILLQGREEEAIQHWEAFHAIEPGEARMHHVLVRNALLDILHTLGLEAPCTEAMRQYVSLVVSRYRGCKRASLLAARAETNLDLEAALQRTFIGRTTRPLAPGVVVECRREPD